MDVDTLRQIAAVHGYELRRKGVKREKKEVKDASGKSIKNCYIPHIRVTASGLARTWKMLEGAKTAFGFDKDKNGEVWEEKLLLCCEHVVRFINKKINDAELGRGIMRLVSPLPKSEYLKRGKKGAK